jgi:single-stranded-DNA-specific exonuclease
VGLKALLDTAELGENEKIASDDIGFRLAPRLNAVGRLGEARLAVELLAATNQIRALDLARHFDELNRRRQARERQISHEAKEMIEQQFDQEHDSAFVLAHADWHPGIIGIVAGRLAERYARPVLMISQREDPGQGSGRSVEDVHLCRALQECSSYLLGFGGHAAAAGFRIAHAQVDAFRIRFRDAVGKLLDGRRPSTTIRIDAEVPLAAVTAGLLRGIDALQPCGEANEAPIFLATNLQVQGTPKGVGNGERHLSFRVKQAGSGTFKAIGFGMAERIEELVSQGGICSLVFAPKRNVWQNFVSIDLEVIDFQAGGTPQLLL